MQGRDIEALPTDPSIPEEENRNFLYNQLCLIVHTITCITYEAKVRRDNEESTYDCLLPHCKIMKGVMDHMNICREGKQCKELHCSNTRQILGHYRKCPGSGCSVCWPLKQHFRNPIFLTNDTTVRKKRMQEHLMELFKAHQCSNQRAECQKMGKVSVCDHPQCQTIGVLVKHMNGCQDKYKCVHPQCASTRMICEHWRSCKLDTCLVCSPMRRAIAEVAEQNPQENSTIDAT